MIRGSMRMLTLIAAILAGACTPYPATAPDLSLVDRFEMVAFGTHTDDPKLSLWRWSWPIRVRIEGDRTYADEVAAHLSLLGEVADLYTEMDATWRPNMIIEFSDRVTRSWCSVTLQRGGTRYSSAIYISTNQPEDEISRCIVQEMTQSLGLMDDLDGRDDTNLTSYGRVIELTDIDLQLIRILRDDRLYDGMPRAEAMPIVRQIVAEMEAEQTTLSQ